MLVIVPSRVFETRLLPTPRPAPWDLRSWIWMWWWNVAPGRERNHCMKFSVRWAKSVSTAPSISIMIGGEVAAASLVGEVGWYIGSRGSRGPELLIRTFFLSAVCLAAAVAHLLILLYVRPVRSSYVNVENPQRGYLKSDGQNKVWCLQLLEVSRRNCSFYRAYHPNSAPIILCR